MSLRTRLLLLVVLAIIPAIGIEIYGEIELRATRQEEIRQDASRIMRLVAAEQQRINEGTRQLLVAFSAGPSIRSRDWPAAMKWLRSAYGQFAPTSVLWIGSGGS